MNKAWTVAVLMACLAIQASGGVRYTATLNNTDEKGRPQKEALGNQMAVQADGSSFKVEFKDAKKKSTGYMLSRDEGKTIYMVDPENKTYFKWDFSAISGLAGGVMNMMQMKISDVKSEAVSSERGPRMLGYPTQHMKYRTTYNVETSILGRKSVRATVMDHEYWVAESLSRDLVEALFKMAPKTGNPDLDKLAEAQRTTIKGFPLKSITTTTSMDAKGKSTTSTSTMEVSDIKEESIPASAFEIPKDYKEQAGLPTFGAGASGEKKEPEKKSTGEKVKGIFDKIF